MPRTVSDPPCRHDDFAVYAEVSRITAEEGGELTALRLDVRVECLDCERRFPFAGVPFGPGFSPTEPSTSLDGCTLSAPLVLGPPRLAGQFHVTTEA